MNALSLSLLIFVLILGGIFLGALLRKMLPENHLSKEAQECGEVSAWSRPWRPLCSVF